MPHNQKMDGMEELPQREQQPYGVTVVHRVVGVRVMDYSWQERFQNCGGQK